MNQNQRNVQENIFSHSPGEGMHLPFSKSIYVFATSFFFFFSLQTGILKLRFPLSHGLNDLTLWGLVEFDNQYVVPYKTLKLTVGCTIIIKITERFHSNSFSSMSRGF